LTSAIGDEATDLALLEHLASRRGLDCHTPLAAACRHVLII